MKPILTCCALALTLLFTGCDKAKDLIRINVTTSVNIDFDINPITETAIVYADEHENLVNELDAAIKAQNSSLGVENIKSAKAESCVVTSSSTGVPADNFTAFHGLTLSIKSDTRPTYQKFAGLTSPATLPYQVELPIDTNVDLTEFLKANTISYIVYYKGNRTTSTTLQCRARVTYLLNVGL